MCRMSFIPKNSRLTVDELESLFLHLERAGGGIGSGIGWFDKSHAPHVYKGMELTCRLLATKTRALLDQDSTLSGVLYHTRLPTSGGAEDYYCHPFATANWITCFNGTWHDFESFKLQLLISSKFTNLRLDPNEIIDANDAGTIALLIEVGDFEVTKLVSNGVILSMNPREVLVRGNYEGFAGIQFEEGDYIFASELPDIFLRNPKFYFEVEPKAICRLFPKVEAIEGQFNFGRNLKKKKKEKKKKRKKEVNLRPEFHDFSKCSGECLTCSSIEECELYWEVDLC